MTLTTDLTALKDAQQKTWSSADYGSIAWLTVPLAQELCGFVEVPAGAKVLDVATGTGHVALVAARQFCDTTGIDYVPELIDTAARRAEAEGLAIDFRVADAEALPFEDGSFDYVLSAIGVMFTADHQRAAGELARVTRPGGRIGMANWTPSGFVGQMLKAVGTYVSPPPGAQPPTRWGTEEVVLDLLGDHVDEVEVATTSVRPHFRSPEHYADFFLTNYGPTFKAAQRLEPDARASFRDDLVTLAKDRNLASDGTFVTDWEYLLVSARKR